MDIAYYTYKNIDTPLGKIHDENGKPILNKDELQLSEERDVRCFILKKGFFPRVVFGDVGFGTLYRTSDRIIFIREPKPELFMRIGNIERATDYALQAKQWKRAGKRESFSLPLEEITNFKRLRNLIQKIHVKDDNGRYVVTVCGKSVNRF